MKTEKIWSAQVNGVSRLIARKLGIMVEASGPHSDLIFSKRKALWTLFRHAVSSVQHQGGKTAIEILRATRVSESFLLFLHYVSPSVTALFNKPSSPLTDQIILLMTPHIPPPWLYLDNGNRIARWNAITLNALKDIDQDVVSVDMGSEKAVSDVAVSVSVVDTLLQSAGGLSLRHRILVENWAWLKKLPPLPVWCRGRQIGTTNGAVRHVRELGDIEILKSYLLLVWSEWDCLDESGLDEMKNSIREDFGGMGRWDDREELIGRLDWVLGRLSQGLDHLRARKPQLRKNDVQQAKSQYSSLKDTLLEGHEEAPRRMSLGLTLFKKYTNPLGRLQDSTCALPLPCSWSRIRGSRCILDLVSLVHDTIRRIFLLTPETAAQFCLGCGKHIGVSIVTLCFIAVEKERAEQFTRQDMVHEQRGPYSHSFAVPADLDRLMDKVCQWGVLRQA